MSLSRILGKPQGAHSFAGDSRWVLPSCMMGWEFEYEEVAERGLPKHTFSGFWTYHEEGSLRDAGAEYVFTNPIFGVDAYNALNWLTDHASKSNWKCSKRTGIHVHIDVRDLEAPQLVGMSILYAALEPLLYKWIGDGRENSHFCLPLYRADQALLATCNILSAALMDHKTDSHATLVMAETYQRYAGFNLQALSKFGSIEFRHMQTTHNLERIIDWGNMLLSLKAASFRLPQSDGAVVRMITKMDIRELLNYVFPPRLAGLLYTPESAGLFSKYGVISARDIAVHSCGSDEWFTNTYPKGKNTGFNKWAKDRPKEELKISKDGSGKSLMNADFQVRLNRLNEFNIAPVERLEGAQWGGALQEPNFDIVVQEELPEELMADIPAPVAAPMPRIAPGPMRNGPPRNFLVNPRNRNRR